MRACDCKSCCSTAMSSTAMSSTASRGHTSHFAGLTATKALLQRVSDADLALAEQSKLSAALEGRSVGFRWPGLNGSHLLGLSGHSCISITFNGICLRCIQLESLVSALEEGAQKVNKTDVSHTSHLPSTLITPIHGHSHHSFHPLSSPPSTVTHITPSIQSHHPPPQAAKDLVKERGRHEEELKGLADKMVSCLATWHHHRVTFPHRSTHHVIRMR